CPVRLVNSTTVLAAARPFEPDDREYDSCSHGDPRHPEMVRQRRNVIDVCAEEKSQQAPDQHPERAASRVEQQKSSPLHGERASHHAVELAQDGEKAGKADGEGAIAREHLFDLAQAIGLEANPSTEAQHYGAAERPAEHIADIVADD